MPVSKRNKQVELSKTKKRGLDRKKKLYEEIRSSVDKYEHIFVFSVSDMRNAKMKKVRDQWKHSRFFIGKNKVMSIALGRFLEEEYQPNLHKVGQMLKGQCGLLFSNQPIDEVLSWFRSYSEGVFARSGNIATADVILKEGPLSQFPHSLEPELRRLGLPTTLTKGIVHLIKDHEVCKEGDTLSPEAAKMLEHLGYEMAEFQVKIQCVWSRDGNFIDLRTDLPDEECKGKKKRRSRSRSKKRHSKSTENEGMEIDENEKLLTESDIKEERNAETERGVEDCKESIKEKEVKSLFKISPNSKITGEEMEISEHDDPNDIACLSPNISLKNEISKENVHQNMVKDDKSNKGTELLSHNCSTPKVNVESMCAAGKSSEKAAHESLVEDSQERSFMELPKKRTKDNKPENDMGNVAGSRQSRPRKRQVVVENNEPSIKEIDIANISQDSPVFRQLRNRSVKFSSKKSNK